MAKARGTMVMAAALIVISGAGCTEARPAPRPTATATESQAPLDALVGVWSRTLPESETAYRFLTDGRYRSVSIIGYEVPGDVFEMRLVQDGTAEIARDRIRLVAMKATTTRTSTKYPEGDYTDRKVTPKSEEFTWSLSGETLSLTAADGTVVVLTKQP